VSRRSGGALRATVAGLVAALLLLVGCSSDASTEATTASTSSTTTPSGSGPTSVPDAGGSSVAPEGFTSVTLVVTRSDGTVEEFCVWLADTPALRQQGLMGVTDPTLGGAGAMVFAFEDDTAGSFWMKDTLLPLSIAFYDAGGAFLDSFAMQPCEAEPCLHHPTPSDFVYAIEVPEGGLEPLGLIPGSTLSVSDTTCRVG
jgi:uncharacterized membrane protein (UPF0127 family)